MIPAKNVNWLNVIECEELLLIKPKDGLCLTFIQPVSQAVKHNFLFAGGNQAESSALHWRSVVNVVFKDEDLDGEKQKGDSSLQSVLLHVARTSVTLAVHLKIWDFVAEPSCPVTSWTTSKLNFI